MEDFFNIVLATLPLSARGGQLSVPNIEKRGSGKNECLGGLDEFLPWIFCLGACYVSCQKKTFNGFEGSISNIDLGLATN